MAEDTSSEVSFISDHYANAHPELVGQKPPIWRQSANSGGFKRVRMGGDIDIEEAFTGAYDMVASLNPDYFSIPYGTRVITIKTDSVKNIEYGIRHGLWSTLEQVSKRIMGIWNERGNEKEKLLFLFSLNGSKQYCGLAEVSAPWNPQGRIDGWDDKSDGCVGTFSLTWCYVKNVPYIHFAHLKQSRNGEHLVTNMWNGQYIESSATEDTGRKVVETYVNAPHISNILAWPKNQLSRNGPSAWRRGGPALNGRVNNGNNQSSENVRAIRDGPLRGGPHRGGHGGYGPRGGAQAQYHGGNGNRTPAPFQPAVRGRIVGEVKDGEPTPVAPNFSGANLSISVPPAHLDGTIETQHSPMPGQVISCVVDINGDFIPVSPPPAHPDAANVATHMPSREYFQRFDQHTYSKESVRSNYSSRGGGSSMGRGGGSRGGARVSNNRQITINHYYGDSASKEKQNDVHHVPSGLSVQTDQPTKAITAGAHQRPALAAEFVPQSDANRSLKRAVATANFMPKMQHSQQLQQTASNTSFATQARDLPLRQYPSQVSFAPAGKPHHQVPGNGPPPFANQQHQHGFHGVATHQQYGNAYAPQYDQRSQASYPSWFRTADSMAGYNTRPVTAMQRGPSMSSGQLMPGHIYPHPPYVRNTDEVSPTQMPKFSELHLKTADWIEKTPTHASFGSAPSIVSATKDVDNVPIEKRSHFYRAMARMADVNTKLKPLGEANTAEYYRLMAEKVEVEQLLSQLVISDNGLIGSSISQLGVAQPDAGTGTTPQTACRSNKHNRSGDGPFASLDARLTQSMNQLVASPVASAKADSVAESERTNPFSESNGYGGAKLT